jgi:hypothetical protein
MKIAVRKNIWGNWNGYIGTKKVFVTESEFDATYWICKKWLDGGYEISKKSDITMVQMHPFMVDNLHTMEK